MWKVTTLIIIMEQYVEGLVHHSNTVAGNENIYIFLVGIECQLSIF